MDPEQSQEDRDHIEPTSSKTMSTRSSDSNSRYCWVCFATDEDDENAAWVQPCNCRGTTKWVIDALLTCLFVYRYKIKLMFLVGSSSLLTTMGG